MADKAEKKSYIVKIDKEKCKGCELCIEFCPANVLELSNVLNRKGHIYAEFIHSEDCIGCKACVLMCPDVCVELFEVKQGNQ